MTPGRPLGVKSRMIKVVPGPSAPVQTNEREPSAPNSGSGSEDSLSAVSLSIRKAFTSGAGPPTAQAVDTPFEPLISSSKRKKGPLVRPPTQFLLRVNVLPAEGSLELLCNFIRIAVACASM